MSRIDPVARLLDARVRREQAGLLRRLRTVDRVQGVHVEIDGCQLLNFSGNDYLGLAGHPGVVKALKQSADEHGVGATAAHLVCGHRRPHAALEDAIAEWTQRERAMLFSTGYMANLGVISALMQSGDLCVQDKLNHACLLDGARLAGCSLKRYPHGDVDGAGRQLSSTSEGAALIATDGVFSMDGDIAPLRELSRVALDQQAVLMVDDAHGLGVIGPAGAGSVLDAGLSSTDVPVLMATLGKALGTCGAFVAGSDALIEALIQFSRTYVYTTAMPPALAAASLASIEIARRETWRRERLNALIDRFRTGARELGLELVESRTAIQPILIGPAEKAVALANALEGEGMLAVAIRPPTVPQGQSRLRITFTASHGESDVDRLLQALELHARLWR